MPRQVPWGTPSRTSQYLYPRGKRPLLAMSFGAGIGVAVLLVVAFLRGGTTVASPGPLSSSHASFENRCAACHSPSVADVRCEYCHDPFGTNRYQNAGHVWLGTKDSARVANAATVDCARCHNEHRGRRFGIVPADDRQCQGCHFSSLAQHPEFALVKAGVMKKEGLQFSHKIHLKAVRKAKLEDCQYCHEPTTDRRGFRPLNFDQHCARCHLKAGSFGATDPIPAEAIVPPREINAAWAKGNIKIEADARGNVIAANLVHKDPWILFNLWRIAGEVDPEGMAAKRAAAQRRVGELMGQLRESSSQDLSAQSLKEEERRLMGEISLHSKGLPGAAERRKAEHALARVRLQLQLGPPRKAALRPRTRSQIETELHQVQSDLANLETATGRSVLLSPLQREKRLAAVAAMTAPCALCHLSTGTLMTPVRAGIPVLTHANYTHLPHIQQVGCPACHTAIAESKKAENVNLPGIATCQSCHRPGRSRSDCAECHGYHPLTEPWPPI